MFCCYNMLLRYQGQNCGKYRNNILRLKPRFLSNHKRVHLRGTLQKYDFLEKGYVKKCFSISYSNSQWDNYRKFNHRRTYLLGEPSLFTQNDIGSRRSMNDSKKCFIRCIKKRDIGRGFRKNGYNIRLRFRRSKGLPCSYRT